MSGAAARTGEVKIKTRKKWVFNSIEEEGN